jgi:hypothetical protein
MSDPVPSSPDRARTVTVRPWGDSLLDRFGHEPRSPYVERFWLPVVGPSGTVLMRRLAERFDDEPDGYPLDLDEVAGSLGMAGRDGPGAAFRRTIERVASFGFVRFTETPAGPCPAIMAVRRRLPTLTQRQLVRLPRSLRDDHESWRAGQPTTEVVGARVHQMALSLLEVGEQPDEVEEHLLRLDVHPEVVHRALRTAFDRPRPRPHPHARGGAA